MIEMRWLVRETNHGPDKVLQYRTIALQIGWSKGDDHPVIQPKGPVSLIAERNWGPWEDVPTTTPTIAQPELQPAPTVQMVHCQYCGHTRPKTVDHCPECQMCRVVTCEALPDNVAILSAGYPLSNGQPVVIRGFK